MKSVDFAELRKTIAPDAVFSFLNIQTKPWTSKAGEECLRAHCPLCNAKQSFSFTVTRGIWFCFKCHETGDLIMLYALLRGFGKGKQKEAAEEMEKTFVSFSPLEYERKLVHEHPAVQALGISPNTAKQLGIGYMPKGLHRGRVVFTIRNRNGTPVHFIGYSADAVPQVKLPKFDPA